MVKKITVGKVLLFLSIMALMLVSGYLAFTSVAVSAEDGISGFDESKQYYVGDIFETPSLEIVSGGIGYDAEKTVLVFPDGQKNVKSNIILKQHGKYRIVCTATVNGKTISAEKTFDVKKKVLDTQTGESTAVYTHSDILNEDGLKVQLAINDTLKLNRIVDLTTSSMTESFIDFSFLPVETGTPDAYTLYMTLNDVYDESNVITVRMKNWSDMGTWADGFIYIDAKAPNQKYTTTIRSDEDFYYAKRDQNTGYGWYTAGVSMVGRNSNGATTYAGIEYFFDYLNRGIMTNKPGNGSQFVTQGGSTYMCDFDDEEFFDLNTESLWNGFTTGEVYIGFSASGYNGSNVNLFITKLLGADISADTPDYYAPSIAIDLDGYSKESLPFAAVGREYKVFSASAYDADDGNKDVTVNVFYDYNGKHSICNLSDGKFTPRKSGEYTIVYCAEDNFGNTTFETLTVTAVPDSDYASISFTAAESGIVGEACSVLSDLVLSGFNGNTEVAVSAEMNGKTDKIGSDFTFIPLIEGTYEITVTVNDYIKSYERTYELTVEENTKPVFFEDAVLGKYYIKNASYSLPELNAYTLSGGEKTQADVKIEYSVAGGAFAEYSGSFVPTAVGGLTVKYTAQANGNSSERIYSAKVVDVGYGGALSLENYFYTVSGNTEIQKSDTDMIISAADDAQIDFINAIQAKNLYLSFEVLPEKNDFTQLDIFLTDSENADVKVKFSFISNGNGSIFLINDGQSKKTISANFSGTGGDVFMLSYSNSDFSVMPSNETTAYIQYDYNGSVFNGFTSDFVYLTYSFFNVGDAAAIHSVKINNQNFFDIDGDFTKPQVVVDKNSGDKRLGDTVVLALAVFADVLDNALSVTMSVKKKGGAYVKAADGTLLDTSCNPFLSYEIVAEEIGTYSIEYSATDSSGNKVSYSYVYNVVDSISPTVTLSGIVSSAKKGATVKVAAANVTDNYSETQLYIVVCSPDAVMRVVESSFVAEQTGTYTVYYYAFDGSGNSTVVFYEVVIG